MASPLFRLRERGQTWGKELAPQREIGWSEETLEVVILKVMKSTYDCESSSPSMRVTDRKLQNFKPRLVEVLTMLREKIRLRCLFSASSFHKSHPTLKKNVKIITTRGKNHSSKRLHDTTNDKMRQNGYRQSEAGDEKRFSCNFGRFPINDRYC